MPFPPPRNHRISLNNARVMTRRYRNSVAKDAIRAFCFPRSSYDAVLAQPGCEGIRSYLGAHEDGKINLILVGVDANMNDILHAPATKSAESTNGDGGGEDGDAEIMQDSFPCPVVCGDGSSLNED
jgi:hypothetical protein